MRRPLFSLSFSLFLVAYASSLVSEEKRPPLIDGGGFDCFPLSTFGLKGLRLWQPESSVPVLLGEPISIVTYWSEDDGGRHDVRTYDYGHIQVDAVRGKVDRIYTESSNTAMTAGIRVGQTMEQIVKILGRKPRGWQGTGSAFTIVTCPENGQWVQEDYVTLRFNNEKVLVSIAYEANRP